MMPVVVAASTEIEIDARPVAIAPVVPMARANPLAEAPVATAVKPAASTGSQSADASRSRRVELPFPLDFRPTDREQRATAPQRSAPDGSEPHPYRETQLKRASLDNRASAAAANFDRRLSRFPDFS